MRDLKAQVFGILKDLLKAIDIQKINILLQINQILFYNKIDNLLMLLRPIITILQ
jgi:hypothetical protein